jgi:hypothetical protein
MRIGILVFQTTAKGHQLLLQTAGYESWHCVVVTSIGAYQYNHGMVTDLVVNIHKTVWYLPLKRIATP